MNWGGYFQAMDLVHSPHVLAIYLCLCVFFILMQLSIHLLEKARPRLKVLELKRRLSSWWKIFGISFLALVCGKLGAAFLFALVSLLAFQEYIKAFDLENLPKLILGICFLAIPFQYALAYFQKYDLFLIFIPLLLHTLLAIALIIRQETKGFIRTLGLLNWGALLSIFCLSHLVYFMNFDNPMTREVEPIGLITLVLITTEFNDVMQYVWGKAFGRYKILPKVSPNKTLEGLLGGMISTALLAYFLGPAITHLDELQSLYSGFLLSFSGFLGDVLMSAIKRDKNIKDFGSLLPGHGGILDRVDSLIMSAPMFFHFYRLFFRNTIL